jgi:hypothetical protein
MSQRDFDYNRGFTAGEGERTTLQSKIDALQALLTAADERADTATSLIQRIVANFDTEIEFHEDVEPNDLEHDQVLADMRVFLGALKPAEPKEGPHLILDICGMPIRACEFMAALGITYQLAVPQSMSDTWWFFNCENVRSSRPSRLRVLDKTAQQCVGWGLSQHMADEIKARCKLPLKPVNLDVSFKPAEPAKDEHVCTGCGSKGWTANCAECVPY